MVSEVFVSRPLQHAYHDGAGTSLLSEKKLLAKNDAGNFVISMSHSLILTFSLIDCWSQTKSLASLLMKQAQ